MDLIDAIKSASERSEKRHSAALKAELDASGISDDEIKIAEATAENAMREIMRGLAIAKSLCPHLKARNIITAVGMIINRRVASARETGEEVAAKMTAPNN